MTFYTSCPVVRRSKEQFQQWVVIGGERQKAVFTKDILWLLESESVVQFQHGGELLMEGRRSNDFYGLFSSTDVSADGLAVDEVAQRYGITRDSSLVLVVATRVIERPVIETQETIERNKERPSGRKMLYAEMPDDWRQERIVDGDTIWPRLPAVEVASGIVWSSKNDMRTNAQLCAQFIEQWARPELGSPARYG